MAPETLTDQDQSPVAPLAELPLAPLDAQPGQGADVPAEAAPASTGAVPRGFGATQAPEDSPLARPITLGGPSCLDLAVFCRQFATLVEVEIPALKAFQMMARRTPNGRLRRAIEQTAREIEDGRLIHQAMSANTPVFTPLVVGLVRVGEAGGVLRSTLAGLAELMESKARIKRRITSAFFYPLLALLAACVAVILIMVMAIPAFKDVYLRSGTEMPYLTQFTIELSNFMVSSWWLLGLGLAAAVAGLKWRVTATPGGARAWSWLALHLPLIKGLSQKIGVACSARILGGLVKAGVPLPEALSVMGDSCENVLIAEALRGVREHVGRGERMAPHLAQARIFPPLVMDMIGLGEETGTLDRMLTEVADIYDAQVESTFNGLASIIEPLLVVALGGVVIFIALAALLPYFRLASTIQGG